MKFLFLLFLFCCAIDLTVHAQTGYTVLPDSANRIADSSAKLKVDRILITGNRKTKSYIIIREMKFKPGWYTPAAQLAENLKLSQQLVYNTNLFSEVKLEPVFKDSSAIDIKVIVKERWYIYPTPQFQLVDRNFNEWINVYHADLDRVIYGAKFAHYNFSGRRDQLRIFLLNGYARNFAVSYISPYSNRTLTEGFGIAASFTQNREIAYATSLGNKLRQYNNQHNFVRNTFSASASYIARKGYFNRHSYQLSFTYMNVEDSVVKFYNPSYFNSAKPFREFLDMGYNYSYLNVNNINYPLTGKSYGVSVLKRGLGFTGGTNMLQLDAAYNRYFDLGKKWYGSIQSGTKLKLPFRQAYINQRAFGFNDFNLRGLEYYVVDGVAAMLTKATLKRKLFAFDIPVPVKNKIVQKIPFAFFAKTFADAGYVYNEAPARAMLNNRFLYTGGFGVDLITLYDINLKFEYSFNQLGEKGLFLHLKGGF
ncbi:MAG: POTRA domain-containing protein [Ferruginibacter sp.]